VSGVAMTTTEQERVDALIGLYQAERADVATMQNVNVAVVSLTIAYAGATAALITSERLEGISPWLIAFLPLPLWMVAVFLTLYSAAAARRAQSALKLEYLLKQIARLDDARAVGLECTINVQDIRKGSVFVRCALFITFGGEFLLACAYSGLMLLQAAQADDLPALWVVPLALYVGLAGMVVAAFISPSLLESRSKLQS
jgi:hypothetical protein